MRCCRTGATASPSSTWTAGSQSSPSQVRSQSQVGLWPAGNFLKTEEMWKWAEEVVVRSMQAAKDTERRHADARDVCIALPGCCPAMQDFLHWEIIRSPELVPMRRGAIGAPAARTAAGAAAPAPARARRRALRGGHLPAGAEPLAEGSHEQHRLTFALPVPADAKCLCGGLPARLGSGCAVPRLVSAISAIADVPGVKGQEKRFNSTGAGVGAHRLTQWRMWRRAGRWRHGCAGVPAMRRWLSTHPAGSRCYSLSACCN